VERGEDNLTTGEQKVSLVRRIYSRKGEPKKSIMPRAFSHERRVKKRVKRGGGGGGRPLLEAKGPKKKKSESYPLKGSLKQPADNPRALSKKSQGFDSLLLGCWVRGQ